jgi:hypothetical protein
MREKSPGPSHYKIDHDIISKAKGKPGTFSKTGRKEESSERSPGPAEYVLHPHVLAKTGNRSMLL